MSKILQNGAVDNFLSADFVHKINACCSKAQNRRLKMLWHRQGRQHRYSLHVILMLLLVGSVAPLPTHFSLIFLGSTVDIAILDDHK